MSKRKIGFYEACHLASKDYLITIEKSGNNAEFYVAGGDTVMVSDDLKEWAESAELQKYTDGIVRFRKQFKKHWHNQKKNSKASKQSKPESESATPIENNSHT